MLSNAVNEEMQKLSVASWQSAFEKGEVYTRPSIVDFMLKVSGVSDSLLDEGVRILEPSCGTGEFVVAIAKLLCSKLLLLDTGTEKRACNFKDLVTAFDVSPESVSVAKQATKSVLASYFSEDEAVFLVERWFNIDDFLLSPISQTFTHVIGNPPYVRIESIPQDLLSSYRLAFRTMKERADLYVPFFEKSLSLLKQNGKLIFICTDRWTKNRYGAALRDFIAESFNIDLFVDLYGQDAFQSNVLTYPAITQISREPAGRTIVVHNPEVNEELAAKVATAIRDEKFKFEGQIVRRDIINGSEPWLFGTADELEFISRLEREYPTIEEVGCKVYIGAATGCNGVFVVDESLDVEVCRKLPMVKASDVRLGMLNTPDSFIINTYDDSGVISLDKYPKLKAYLEKFESKLRARHVAKNSPKSWFKTIDRVYPERAKAEKLLIPDIKSQLTVIYDEGKYHPNNSLYYICSETWDLRALQGLLLSGIGQLFVEIYSTKVAGGNLRFQAQHLRRLRLPFWNDVSEINREKLRVAALDMDTSLAKEAVCCIYRLTEKEKIILGC